MFQEFSSHIIPRDSDRRWTEGRLRNPKPSWADLERRLVATPESEFKAAMECLRSNNCCIVVGEMDSGKTWLCYLIAHHYIKFYGPSVVYCQVNEDFSCREALSYFDQNEILTARRERTLVILDDCHRNADETEELVSWLLDRENYSADFLFAMRRTGRYVLRDTDSVDAFYNAGTTKQCIIDMSRRRDKGAYLYGIVKCFIRAAEISHDITEAELNHLRRTCGNDLFFLRLLLDVWRKSGRSIESLGRQALCDSLWDSRDDIALANPARRAIFAEVARFCQFEPLMAQREFVQERTRDFGELQAICDAGLLTVVSHKTKDYFHLSDTLSDLILLTIEMKVPGRTGRVPQTYAALRDYILSHPQSWTRVLTSLSLGAKSGRQERRAIAQGVLGELIQSPSVVECGAAFAARSGPGTLRNILRAVRSHEHGAFVSQKVWSAFIGSRSAPNVAEWLVDKPRTLSTANAFLALVNSIDPSYVTDVIQNLTEHPGALRQLADASSMGIRFAFLSKFGSVNKDLYQAVLGAADAGAYLAQQMEGTSATRLASMIDIVGNTRTNVRRPLAECSPEGWRNIVERSTLNSVRLLIHCLMHWRAYDAARGLCSGLCATDLKMLLNRPDSTLYRLNGLLYIVPKVDETIAEKFVESLCRVPIRELLIGAVKDTQTEHSRGSQVNGFLAGIGRCHFRHIANVVGQLSDSEWGEIILGGSVEVGLWIVWSIFKGDMSRAKSVVQAMWDPWLEKVASEGLEARLLAIGVTALCELDLRDGTVEVGDSADIVKSLVGTNENTKLVLTLVGLKEVATELEYRALTASVPRGFADTLGQSEHAVDRLLAEIVLAHGLVH